jgi:hypothetical protein
MLYQHLTFTEAQEGQVLLTKTIKQVNQIHDLLQPMQPI